MSVRTLTVLTRRSGMTQDEFARHWLEIHAPLVRQLPHIRRYAQNHVVTEGARAGYPTADYQIDGVVDFVFESWEHMATAFEGPDGERAMADARNFVETMRVYQVEEHVIVNREEAL